MLTSQAPKVSQVFKAMGDPFRLQILSCIGEGEACVCHLERMLAKRQAYISQHLMAMRAVGILTARREGKYVYYRLSDPRWLAMIRQAYEVAGYGHGLAVQLSDTNAKDCNCPQCGKITKKEKAC